MKGKWAILVSADSTDAVYGPFEDYQLAVDWAEKLPIEVGWSTILLFNPADRGGTDVQETEA